jgi:hypothetical protein
LKDDGCLVAGKEVVSRSGRLPSPPISGSASLASAFELDDP